MILPYSLGSISGNFYTLVRIKAILKGTYSILLILRGLDEHVPVYIVLRISLLEENTLRSYLSRLAINLETYATGVVHPPNAKPNDSGVGHKELLHSETIEESEEPLVVASNSQADDDSAAQQYVHVFWKVNVTIGMLYKAASRV